MNKDPRDIILAPIVSEKSYDGIDIGKYTFRVAGDATKPDIARAVEQIFKVGVTKVNTLKVKPKPKRQGYSKGHTAAWKKAIVTLKAGETIEIFGGR
jgi:large subunit ribosomal protein L23